jgi:hypothetical protein
LLKRWLRYAENLKALEEKMICHCWTETGKDLDGWDDEEFELGSSEDLKNCQEGKKEEIPNYQMGKGTDMRSTEDLMDCQEDSEEVSHCQLGNEQRLLWNLEDCQEGSGSVSNCQEGSKSIKDCQEGRDEHLIPSEGLIKISIQKGVLMRMGSMECKKLYCRYNNHRRKVIRDCQGGIGADFGSFPSRSRS